MTDIKAYITNAPLHHCIQSLTKMQTLLDDAVRERSDFLARYGEISAAENGQYLAYIIREDAVKGAMGELTDAIVERFGGGK